METAVNHRPFLRRAVKLPRIMAFYPAVTIICNVLYFIHEMNLLVTAAVTAACLLAAIVIVCSLGDKMKPVSPVPSGYSQPMWIVLIAYPIYTLSLASVAYDIFFR